MAACNRCGFVATSRQGLEKHLRRKRRCLPHLSNDDGVVEEQLKELNLTKRSTGLSDSVSCTLCNAKFTAASNMYRHRKQCCVKSRNNLQDRVQHLEQRLEALSKSSGGSVVNNNTTTNNMIQINVQAFGQETLSHITPSFLERCIRRTDKGLLQLLHRIHFEDRSLGNDTVRITNKKMPLAEVRVAAPPFEAVPSPGSSYRWEFRHRDKVLSDMLQQGHGLMQEHWDEQGGQEAVRNNSSESLYQHIRDWMEKVADKDKETLSELLCDIYCLILNNQS